MRAPAHGVATLGSYGRLRYRPEAGFTGADLLTYRTRDSYGLWSGPAVVTLRVGAANRPPTGMDDAYQTGEDIPIEVSAPGVLANDADPDGDDLVAQQLTGTQHGGVQLEPDGSFVFDPGLDQDFDVYFTYRVGDGHSERPDHRRDRRGRGQRSTGRDGRLLRLDRRLDRHDRLARRPRERLRPGRGRRLYRDHRHPAADGHRHALTQSGGFTFTADPGEYRWDSFSYSACDGGGCASAQVTFEISTGPT